MAVTADKVVVELELRDGQYLARVRQNERAFTQAQNRTAQSAENAERRIKASSAGISAALRSAALGLAAGVSVAAITRLADSYTSLQNRLKATGLEGAALKQVEDSLYEAANRNGVAVEATASLYQRAAMARENLGATEAQLQQLVSGTTAALKLQGTSSTEASGALLQLGQVLGGSTVQAQEYNSLIDGLPTILEAVAKGSERWGGSVTKLTQDVKSGQVSSQEFFQAALKGFEDIEARAGKSTTTVGAALQTLNNQFGRYVGQTDTSLSATARLAGGIELLARNLDTVIPAIAVISGVFASRYAASLITASFATDGFITKGREAVASAIADERAKTAAVAAGTRARVAAYTAESIALRAQVDTGRNAAGQFVSRAKSAEALAVANRNLAGSIAPATVATVRASGAMTAATAGAKAFGSGLLALAGGPIGATILGVAAVVMGLNYLKNTYGDAAVAARELAATQERGRGALARYEEAQIKARDATKEGAKAAREHAAAMKLETKAALEASAALVLKRLAAARDAQASAAIASSQADQAYSRGGTSEGSRSINAGLERTAQGARDRLERANDQLKDAVDSHAELNNELARVARGINLGGVPDLPAPSTNAGGSSSGASQDDLDAQREMLLLQGQLEVLRAQGNEDAIRAKEREIDLINLTKSYTDAGFADAAQMARDQIAAVSAAEDAARTVDEALEQSAKRADRRARTQQYLVDQQRRENDLLLDRLEYEARLASLSGDPKRQEQAERELFIEQRINELLRDREGLITAADSAAARTQAEGEWSETDSTARQGRLREEFRNSFRDGIKSAIDGDLGGFFESMADRFTDRMLDNLADDLFNLLSQASKGFGANGGGGGNFLASVFAAFGGGRALGGPVRAGFSYDVGENGREKFVAPANGYIMPNMDTVAARSSGGALSVNINLAGANGDATIHRIARHAAMQGTAAAISQSRTDAANEKRLSRYRMSR